MNVNITVTDEELDIINAALEMRAAIFEEHGKGDKKCEHELEVIQEELLPKLYDVVRGVLEKQIVTWEHLGEYEVARELWKKLEEV